MNNQQSISLKKSFLVVIALFGLSYHSSFAQADKSIDSLMKIRNTGKEDTNQVNILNALSDELINKNKYDEAKLFADTSLIIANKINFRKGIGKAYSILGVIDMNLGDYPEALKYSQASLKISEEIGDKRKMAISYSNIGLISEYQGNYSEAIKNHQAGLDIRKEIGDKKGMAGSYNNLGIVYDDQGNYPEALKNYMASLKIYQEAGDDRGFATANNNIGIIYQRQGNYPEALKNYQTSLAIRKKLGDKTGIFDSSASIGDIYYLQMKYTDALTIYQDAIRIAEEIGDKRRIADAYEGLGNINKGLHRFTAASNNYLISLKMRQEMDDKSGMVESYFNLAQLPTTDTQAEYYLEHALSLSKEIGYIDGVRSVYLSMPTLDSLRGNFRSAFAHHKLYTMYNDSLFNLDKSEQIADMKEKYESEKKQNEIELLNKEKAIQALDIKKQKITKNYFITGSVLLAILTFFVYRNYRTQHQLKLQTLRNKIARDLHDDVGSTLSSISIFSQMAQEQSKETIPLLETIEESSRKMLDAMADIVWTINPENDQFEKIILRMRSFAFELLGAKNIEFEFVADDDVSKMKSRWRCAKIFILFLRRPRIIWLNMPKPTGHFLPFVKRPTN
jgi:tetratricopeptide (TPR) repeat protein